MLIESENSTIIINDQDMLIICKSNTDEEAIIEKKVIFVSFYKKTKSINKTRDKNRSNVKISTLFIINDPKLFLKK